MEKNKEIEKALNKMEQIRAMGPKTRYEMKELLSNLLSSQRKEIEKAFGGCRNCWGKGFATVKAQAQSFEDFGGEKTEIFELDPIRPCSCDRGKQIKEMLSTQKKEIVEKIRQIDVSGGGSGRRLKEQIINLLSEK